MLLKCRPMTLQTLAASGKRVINIAEIAWVQEHPGVVLSRIDWRRMRALGLLSWDQDPSPWGRKDQAAREWRPHVQPRRPTGHPSQLHLAFWSPSPHQAISRAILWGTGSGYLVLFSPYTNVATGREVSRLSGWKAVPGGCPTPGKVPKALLTLP